MNVQHRDERRIGIGWRTSGVEISRRRDRVDNGVRPQRGGLRHAVRDYIKGTLI